MLPGSKEQQVSPDDDLETEVEFYWVGSDARIAGTLVHRWLHLLAEKKIDPAYAQSAESRQLSLRWLRESGIGEDAGAAIAARVQQAVSAALEDDKGRWVVDGDGHAELGLSGVVDDEVVSVLIDRVRIDDDGTHWIIDYKTSTHEGGDLKGFLQVESDRYQPQLQRYATIYREWAHVDVKCALYFPLLKTFLEVGV